MKPRSAGHLHVGHHVAMSPIMCIEDSVVFSFLRNGYIQFAGALAGSFVLASFLPSPSLVLFAGAVMLVFACVAFRPASQPFVLIRRALNFRTCRDMMAIYGSAFTLGACFEYAHRYLW